MLGALRAALARVISTIRAFGATLQPQAEKPKTEAPRFGDYEKVEEAKYHSPVPPSASGEADLPEWSGRPGVTLMAVDPYLVHVYWDFDPTKLPPETTAAVLRFYDAASQFDVGVDLRTRNWYVPIWSPSKTYYADLGAVTAAGEFIPLVRSNTIQTSRAWPVVEVEHRLVPGATMDAGEKETVSAASAAGGTAASPPSQTPAVSPTIAEPASAEATALSSPASGIRHPASAVTPPTEPYTPKPPDAAEILRRRLSEIDEFRHWQPRSYSPWVDSPAPDLPDQQWQPEAQGTGLESARAVPTLLPARNAPDDLTGRAEREFAPGLSSLLLGGQGPAKPAG
jgi:hypothetical protein